MALAFVASFGSSSQDRLHCLTRASKAFVNTPDVSSGRSSEIISKASHACKQMILRILAEHQGKLESEYLQNLSSMHAFDPN